jgi:hypothetical protein
LAAFNQPVELGFQVLILLADQAKCTFVVIALLGIMLVQHNLVCLD